MAGVVALSSLFDRLFSKPAAAGPALVSALGDPPAELVEALRGGRCFLFVGEEFSRQCSLPVWSYLMLGLGEYLADTRRIDREDGDKLRLIHHRKAFDHLERVVRTLVADFPEVLPEYLKKTYARPVVLPPSHELLRKLPFAGLITPNLDAAVARVAGGPEKVIRLRGDLANPESVRFWPEEAEGPGREACAAAVGSDGTVLFVGTSAGEIGGWFSAPEGDGPHFALWPDGSAAVDAKLAAKLGIRSLTYDASSSAALVEFLKKLDVAARKDHAEAANATG